MSRSKKGQQPGWPEAKKLCRLNQNDIEMAKRLGFKPESLWAHYRRESIAGTGACCFRSV